MSLWQGAFLGFLQGVTEFLPVSSSGHLALFQHLFGMSEPNLFFDISVHVGTLLSVILFYRRELYNMIIDVLAGAVELIQGNRWSDVTFKNPQIKFFILILVASIPTGLAGIYLKDFFEELFGSLLAVGFGFWITTIFVWLTQLSQKHAKQLDQMNPFHALVIGTFQGISIAPGISRAGSTIASALFCGIDRTLAARFSFIMSIPAILAAMLLELRHVAKVAEPIPPLGPIIVGTVIAAVVGYLAIKFLIRVLTHGNFYRFAYYTLFMGAFTLVASLFIK